MSFAAESTERPMRSADLAAWEALGLTRDESGNPRKPLPAKDAAKIRRARWAVNTPEFAIRVLEMRFAGVPIREIARVTGKDTGQIEGVFDVAKAHGVHVREAIKRAANQTAPLRADLDSFGDKWAELRDAGVSCAMVRVSLGLTSREANRLEGRYAQRDGNRTEVQDLEACTARHASACIKAGGFWSLSEEQIGIAHGTGARLMKVCLPLLPPVAR